jgi:hypothetical protein
MHLEERHLDSATVFSIKGQEIGFWGNLQSREENVVP